MIWNMTTSKKIDNTIKISRLAMEKKGPTYTQCPCSCGKTYQNCCKIFHEGTNPSNALQLMRSRYSAYAYSKPDYIIKTTHPANLNFKHNAETWRSEIILFCKNTHFQDLKIIEFIDGKSEAYVTFIAYISQNGKNASFVEKSHFEKLNGIWLYKSGIVKKPLS
jgi:SEC-C motif-containing protein